MGLGLFTDVALALARPFQTKTILFQWLKIETTQLLFGQSMMLNRSSDLRGSIELAKFRQLIYLKLDPEINKIYRYFSTSGKPRISGLTRCVYFRGAVNTSEILSW